MSIKLQPTSKEIWMMKYQLKDSNGKPIDKSLKDTYTRIARGLADVEPGDQEYWFEKFQWALNNGATPAGRIMSNVGAGEHKPATSTVNCVVSGSINDTMDNILTKVHEAGLSLKSGAGIGYCFSTLRPKGAFVAGAGATTSGPLSFMDIYDKMCFTVSSAGGRRGAQMATFDVQHPDVFEFIKAKREDGRLRQFNLSLLITEEFIEAVKGNKDFPLVFPFSIKEYKEGEDCYWRKWPGDTSKYITNEKGEVACRVYRTVSARELWDAIMTSTYNFAEPGFLLVDKVNEMNNNRFCEEISATNPCMHPDSMIETLEGRVRIADMKEPTIVYTMAKDGSLGLAECSPSWLSKENAETIKITVRSGKSITCTPDHKVFVQTKGWVPAKDLQIEDKLVHLCIPKEHKYDPSIVSIEEGPVTDVYDLHVDGTHNFISDYLVVHNCGKLTACLSLNIPLTAGNPARAISSQAA